MEITVNGIDALTAQLNKIAEATEPAVANAGAKAGEMIAQAGAANAPVAGWGEHTPPGHDPGTLRAEGVGWKVLDDGGIGIGFTRRGYYGIFPELGTAHQGAEPFLVPAFERNKDAVVAMIQQAVSDAIEDNK